MLWTSFIFIKYRKNRRSDIKDSGQRYQLVLWHNIWKTFVSFRYQLKCPCDMFIWSVSLRYQLVHCYDVSNWSVWFTYLWDVAKMSQKGPTYWCTSWDVLMISYHGRERLSSSVKWFNFFRVLGSKSLTVSGGSVSLRYQLVRQHLKEVRLI